MNPQQQQQPTSQPSSITCTRHPDETFSTFCPLCLCERLTTLDQSTAATTTTSSSHRHSTSAAIKSLFTNTNSLLRRTKSFSAARNEPLSFDTLTLSSLFVNDQQIQHVTDVNDDSSHIAEQTTEIAEIEEELDAIDESLKKMKEHIDGTQFKKHSKSKIWSVSVLSKKWQNWRKKNSNKANEHVLPVVDKSIASQYRETQSEIADYGCGRRSCDVDPRFSLDVGRVSFDDPRYSFDEPRASWDGYMIGRSFPRLPPMVEDVAPVIVVPQGTRVPVDEGVVVDDDIKDDLVPGGLGQTKEYYTDSSSKRRKSLERSSSIRKMVAEMDETKLATSVVSNGKISPASVECNYGRNGGLRVQSIGCERELARDSNANSLRDDCSESFELRFRDGEKKEGKKTRRWKWKLWGFIQRRGNKDDDEDDRFSRLNGVARSYSGSWEQSGTNQKVFRSNSSVSWRNSSVDIKKSNSEMNRLANGKNRRVGGDEFVLERNRSAMHSPNHADSGFLRFYLTPLRGTRRSKPTSNSNNSIARNTLRL